MPINTDPAFYEKLAHRKRTDVCFNDFSKRPGREDNFVYNISEGFNLRGAKGIESDFDKMLALKMAQKEHEYRNLQDQVLDTAQFNSTKKKDKNNAKLGGGDDDSDIASSQPY